VHEDLNGILPAETQKQIRLKMMHASVARESRLFWSLKRLRGGGTWGGDMVRLPVQRVNVRAPDDVPKFVWKLDRRFHVAEQM
jgi:hypothetical protein